MKEIWKSIDDRYSVSNMGRVKSNYANKEKVLKPWLTNDGYAMIELHGNGCSKTIGVHRLVAKAFIPNPDNLPQVNHKDENKTNNCVDNLEWCTLQYNCNYGTRNIRKGLNCRKAICSVDKYGNVVHYDSRLEASKKTGIEDTSISKALTGTNKTAGNMLWFYDDGSVDKMVKETGLKATTYTKSIYSIDREGIVERYESITEAHKKTGINNIGRALKNGKMAGGRNWYYED